LIQGLQNGEGMPPVGKAAGQELIRFDNVRLKFGAEEIYDGIDLSVREGEFVCLLGPSGCGKSTALRLMAALMQPTSGSIRVAEEDPEVKRGEFAFVFQSPRLVPWRHALGNVLLGAQLRFGRVNQKAAHEKAMRLLELVGLAADAHKMPAIMSGGERQRVAIARALMVEPRIVLMDEPFSALDPSTRDRMRREIITIWQETDKTIVFVTHDIDEALLLADRILVFSKKPTRVLETITIAQPRWRDLSSNEAMCTARNHLHALMHGEKNREEDHEN
jgi:NitT/TauT family transport system ATP-binding protein